MGFARSLPAKLVERIEGFSRRSTIFALMIFGIGILGPARDLLWSDPQRLRFILLIVTVLGAGMAYLTAIVMFRQASTTR